MTPGLFLFPENMITLTEFAILILACFRLMNFIIDDQNDSGPFEVFDRIRYRLGWRYRDGKVVLVTKEGRLQPIRMMIAEASICKYCLSVWFGIFIAIAYLIFPTATIYLCLPFALSAGAILVKKWSK